MRIKVYIVEVKAPRCVRRTLVLGGAAIAILGLSALVYAAAVNGQPDYNNGETLTAASLNARFAALQNQAPPPNSVVLTTLSAADLADTTKFSATGLGAGAHLGWAVCNGNNGTANLAGRFPRMITTGAGTTGGEDANSHAHAAGSITAMIDGNDTYIYYHTTTAQQWAGNRFSSGGWNPGGNYYTSGVSTQGVTESASDAENRPAFYELVPLCKI